MSFRKICLVVATTILLLTAPAAAEDKTYIQNKAPAQICLPDKSKCTDIPAGRFLDEKSWVELDAKFKQSEDDATRYKAENDSLRKSADSFHWLPVTIGAALGIALGVYVGSKL